MHYWSAWLVARTLSEDAEVGRPKLSSGQQPALFRLLVAISKHTVSRYLVRHDQSRQGPLERFTRLRVSNFFRIFKIIAGLGQGTPEQVQHASRVMAKAPRLLQIIPRAEGSSPMSKLDVAVRPISPKAISTSKLPL